MDMIRVVWEDMLNVPLHMAHRVNSLLSKISFINLKTTQPAGVGVQDKADRPSLVPRSVHLILK